MKHSALFFCLFIIGFLANAQVWHSNRHFDKVFKFAFGYPLEWTMKGENGYYEIFISADSKQKLDGFVTIEPIFVGDITADDYFTKLVEEKYPVKYKEFNLLQWGNLMVNGSYGKWGVFRFEHQQDKVVFCHVYVIKEKKRMFLAHTFTRKENHEINGKTLRAIVQSIKIE